MEILDILADPFFTCDYTDHKGKTSHVRLRATRITFDAAGLGYNEKQWLMKATNLDTKETEWFAMKDMKNVTKFRAKKNQPTQDAETRSPE